MDTFYQFKIQNEMWELSTLILTRQIIEIIKYEFDDGYQENFDSTFLP